MFNAITFVQPLWLLLFIPIVLLLFGLWRARVHQIEVAGKGIVAPHLATVFSLQGNKKSSLKPIILTLISTALVIIAMAGPQLNLSGDEKIKSPLIIALDLSDSMQKENVDDLNNLEQGKLIIEQLLQKGFNRPISLIAFAGSSHQVLPASEQLKLLRVYLGYLEPSVMPQQGDDLNQLLLEINRIKEAQEFGYDLLIVSDGFNVDDKAFKTLQKNNSVLLLALNDSVAEQGNELEFDVLTGKYLDSGDNSLYKLLSDLGKQNHSETLMLTNVGYWLLFPVLFIVLYFFRKGFNLHWVSMLVLFVMPFTPNPAQASFIDWWMTADQQGAYYFEKQDYQEAAIRFENKQWKAAAYVYGKEYQKAIKIYQQQDDLTGLFNLAVANTKARNYPMAKKLYELLLEIDPDNQDAAKNLTIITALIKEIQDMGESQQEEEPPSENDDSQDMADQELGADKQEIGKREVKIETLSLNELLSSEQKKQQWLRDISRDPKLFLEAKFQAQYNNRLKQGSDE